MFSEKLNNLIEQIKSLTLLETFDLVNEIEKVFSINETSVKENLFIENVPAISESTKKINTPEKTLFNISLLEIPVDKKVPVLKIVRSVTGLPLKESKEIVDNLPKLIKEGISKEDLDKIKKEFEATGAIIKID